MSKYKRDSARRTIVRDFDSVIQIEGGYNPREAKSIFDLRNTLPVLTHPKMMLGRRVRRICQDCYFESNSQVGEDNRCIDFKACYTRQRLESDETEVIPKSGIDEFLSMRNIVETPTATIQTGRTNNGDSGLSGKDRLLEVLRNHAKPNGWLPSVTINQIAREAKMDEHEAIHFIKDSLVRDNMVTFRDRKGKAGAISRLRLTPIAMGKTYAKGTENWLQKKLAARQEQLAQSPRFSPTGKRIGRPPNSARAEAMAEALADSDTEKPQEFAPKKFQLIEALISRRELLTQAAKTAELAGAEDLAIQLMERADAQLSPFEYEAIELLMAYKACNDKS